MLVLPSDDLVLELGVVPDAVEVNDDVAAILEVVLARYLGLQSAYRHHRIDPHLEYVFRL